MEQVPVKMCRNCAFWSALHHESVLDESVCGLTVRTVTAGSHACRLWRVLTHERRHG